MGVIGEVVTEAIVLVPSKVYCDKFDSFWVAGKVSEPHAELSMPGFWTWQPVQLPLRSISVCLKIETIKPDKRNLSFDDRGRVIWPVWQQHST